jgi:hypothetical protein
LEIYLHSVWRYTSSLFGDIPPLCLTSPLFYLFKINLHSSNGKVKIQGKLSEVFDIERTLRQGGVLSTVLFNTMLDKEYWDGSLWNNVQQNETVHNECRRCISTWTIGEVHNFTCLGTLINSKKYNKWKNKIKDFCR